MSTEDFQRKLNSIEAVGENAVKSSSPAGGVIDTAANVAKYTSQVAQQKISTEIENARVTSQSPEELQQKIQDISNNSPFLGFLASRELSVAELSAQSQSLEQQTRRRLTAEKGLFHSILGFAGNYSNIESFQPFFDTKVEEFLKSNSPSAEFEFTKEQAKKQVENFFQIQSQDKNINIANTFSETEIAKRGGLSSPQSTQQTIAYLEEKARTVTSNEKEVNKHVYNELYNLLNKSSNIDDLDNVVQSGYVQKNTKDYKVLSASITGRVERNKQAERSSFIEKEKSAYSDYTSIGIHTKFPFKNERMKEENNMLIENNNSAFLNGGTIAQRIANLQNPELNKNIDSPFTMKAVDMLMAQASYISQHPIEWADKMGDLTEKQAVAVNQLPALNKDQKGNLIDMKDFIENFNVRVDIASKVQGSAGVFVQSLYSDSQAMDLKGEYQNLSSFDKKKFVAKILDSLQIAELGRDVLSNTTGDENLNIFTDLKGYKAGLSGKFLDNYFNITSENQRDLEKGKATVRSQFFTQGKTIPSQMKGFVETYLVATEPQFITAGKNDTTTVDITNHLSEVAVSETAKPGSVPLYFPKSGKSDKTGEQNLLKAMKKSKELNDALLSIAVNPKRLKTIQKYQDYAIITQDDFNTFHVQVESQAYPITVTISGAGDIEGEEQKPWYKKIF